MDHAPVTEYEWSQLFVETDLFCNETMEKWWLMPRVDALPPDMLAPTLEELTDCQKLEREILDREDIMQLLFEIDRQVAS